MTSGQDEQQHELELVYGLIDLEREIERFPPDPESAARHRAEILIKTDTLRVVLVTMLRNGRMHDHSAPGPITVHVLHGAIRFTVGDEGHELRAGQLISLAPGTEHAVEGIEDGAFLLTIAHMSRIPNPGGDGASSA
jgi:quercetin dioxygenase-like cupin family protein